MLLSFTKYQGTGNDFVMIDNRNGALKELSNEIITKLCQRRFGIGADGLILISESIDHSFKMQYHNSDGTRSFCGNGARCALHFAYQLGMFEKRATFEAIDGIHSGEVLEDRVALQMNDVKTWSTKYTDYIIHTGSPHYIRFTTDIEQEDITTFGKAIRYSESFAKEGINVNLVQRKQDHLSMLTYERGVEAETYSCGTGATAVALADVLKSKTTGAFKQSIKVKGGDLMVTGTFDNTNFSTIYLIGPAEKVFDGTIEI